MENLWLTSAHACKIAGVTRQSLTKMARSGRIRLLRDGKTVLYWRASIEAWRAARDRRAAAAVVCSVEPTDQQPTKEPKPCN
ncbi:MAG: helix-turn-helix domain-containing protein [Deltaproteobacteria bacterium]|nr:helix-turn-helix domain-containing protein [Deltaproteobacteria bacterium]